jgi:hypothetical protein
MELTKKQKDLFRISKAKLSRDMGRDLTDNEIEKLSNTLNTNFPTDEDADKALKTLAAKLILYPEVWDDWMNKGYKDYEDRKKKPSKSPKRKPVKKCKCK